MSVTPRDYLLAPHRAEAVTRGRLDVLRCLDAADALGVPASGVDLERADATDARAAVAAAVSSVALTLVDREQDERRAATHQSACHDRDATKAARCLAELYGALAGALRASARLARLDLIDPQETPP